MTAVLLTFHTLIVLGLIGVVLLQRSDGAALGMGGGGSGGFMSGRGAANALTRTTSILAALFFATSLILAVTAGSGADEAARIEARTGGRNPAATDSEPEPLSTRDLLDTVGGEQGDIGDSVIDGAAPLTEDALLESLGAAVEPAGEATAETLDAVETPAEDAAETPAEDEPAAEDETPQG